MNQLNPPERSYKHGNLSIEVRRIPTQHGYHVSVSAWHGDFWTSQQCGKFEFRDGKLYLSKFEKKAAAEFAEYQKQQKLREMEREQVTFTDSELEMLRKSPEVLEMLIDHYGMESAKLESADSVDECASLERRRDELIDLKESLDIKYPPLRIKDLPTRIGSTEELEAIGQAQFHLVDRDPTQAVINLRWLLGNVWSQWQAHDRALRRLGSMDPQYQSAIAQIDEGWLKDTIHELRQADPQAGLFAASTDDQLAAALALAIADHFSQEICLNPDETISPR